MNSNAPQRIIFIFCFAAHAIASAGCANSTDHSKDATPTTRANGPTTEPALDAQYATLARDIVEYNGTPPRIGAWTLNSEHLFLGIDDPLAPDSLRQRTIRFSRRPGALNFLFARLVAPTTSPEDQLVITEILVFFGQYHLPGDEAIRAPAALEARGALQRGAFIQLDKRFDAPVQRMISYSVQHTLEDSD